MNKECLGGLLQCLDRLALPPQARNRQYVTADFADEPREGELQHQEVGRLLVPPDLAQRDRPGPVAVWPASGDGVAGYMDIC